MKVLPMFDNRTTNQGLEVFGGEPSLKKTL
jgi:hypothetical protein